MDKNVIEIIKGDTCQKNIIVNGVSSSLISNIYFSSEKLGIEKVLTYDDENEKYVLRIESEETKDLEVVTTDYDLTIQFTDEDITTVLYRGIIKVLPKINKVGELSND